MDPLLRSRASGRITLDDVARAAGVSRITASRAIRGERKVEPATRSRVMAAAQALGYVPDPAARALASSRSSHVAVFIPMLSNALFVDLLEAVHSTLRPAGYHMLIGVTHYDPAEEEALLSAYMAHRPAGLLVTGLDRTLASKQLIAQSGAPCVHLMETSNDPGEYSVGLSHADAGRAVAQHLIDRGRRRIAFIATQLDPRVLQRAEGYRIALKAAGLYDRRLESLNKARSSIELGGQLFARMMQRHPDVDAIFFGHDDIAQGALLAAPRLGIEVPADVAVAGFNDLAGSAQMLPPLTTVRTPRAEIGTCASQMLLKLIRGESIGQQRVDLGYRLMVREST